MSNERKIPSNEHAETIVLSACLNSIDALNKTMDRLNPESFYHGNNELYFGACRKRYMQNLQVDAFSVIADLGDAIKPRDADMIISLRNYYNIDTFIDEYIEKIEECWHLRRLYQECLSMTDEILYNKTTSDETVEKYVSSYTEIISGKKHQLSTMKEVLEDFYDGKNVGEYLKEKRKIVLAGGSPYQGTRSFYTQLDQTIGAFQDGCLHYIGARTSMGKTTFVLNLVQNIMKNEPDTPIGFFSLEMTKEVIVAKLLCMKACVPFSKYARMMFSEEEFQRICEAYKMMQGNLIIDDGAMDISKLSAIARRLVNVEGVKIIFIDYLTCVKASQKFNTKHERVDQVSKGLLSLSKELKIPIVCLAQLNRALTNRPDKTPSLADFRESGSIEEDCDVAMLIHRPMYYDAQSTDPYTHVIVAKNRLIGNLCKIKYEWLEEQPGTYREMEKSEDLIAAQVSVGKDQNARYNNGNSW